jgi:hypothetical protein
MITIFTIPKPFIGNINIIQRNAIKSWMQMNPECEIFLIGNEDGVKEITREFGLNHIAEIQKNNYNTPLLSSAFQIVENISKNNLLMYINADIILFQNIAKIINKINFSNYLITGRRWDLDVKEEIDFKNENMIKEFLKMTSIESKLHGYAGMDYFIFKKGTIKMPSFAVGRPGWDSWLIYNMKKRNIPIIDATKVIYIIHQNHDYKHSIYGKQKRVVGPEFYENIKIAGGLTNMLTLREADYILSEKGIEKPKFIKNLFSYLSKYYFWRLILALKRKVQNFFE